MFRPARMPSAPLPVDESTASDPTDTFLGRLFARYVAFCERRAGVLVLLFAALAVGTLYPVSKLQLHTDMAELLPDNHAAVQALKRIGGKQRSSTNLVVMIKSPDREANRRFAEALRPKL